MNMPFVGLLTSETPAVVKDKTKTIFSEHGVTDVLHIDNGPYKPRVYYHITSSPLCTIQRIHTAMCPNNKEHNAGKCTEDPEYAMLWVRTTFIDNCIRTMAELLYTTGPSDLTCQWTFTLAMEKRQQDQ